MNNDLIVIHVDGIIHLLDCNLATITQIEIDFKMNDISINTNLDCVVIATDNGIKFWDYYNNEICNKKGTK